MLSNRIKCLLLTAISIVVPYLLLLYYRPVFSIDVPWYQHMTIAHFIGHRILSSLTPAWMWVVQLLSKQCWVLSQRHQHLTSITSNFLLIISHSLSLKLTLLISFSVLVCMHCSPPQQLH